MTDFLFDVIATELEDAVGRENCYTRTIDKLTHGIIKKTIIRNKTNFFSGSDQSDRL